MEGALGDVSVFSSTGVLFVEMWNEEPRPRNQNKKKEKERRKKEERRKKKKQKRKKNKDEGRCFNFGLVGVS